MITRRAALLAVIAFPAMAASPIGAVNVQDGPAAAGHDVVAYFAVGRATPGRADLTAQHEGATYRFSNDANRDAFVAAPSRYLPQYGGYCAFGLARGYKAVIDPKAFTLVDGKLYLNYSLDIQAAWRRQKSADISLANANWPNVINSAEVVR